MSQSERTPHQLGHSIASDVIRQDGWSSQVETWGESHAENRAVLDRLSSEQERGYAFAAFTAADPQRAQAEFLRRLAARRSARRRRLSLLAVASVAVLMLVWGGGRFISTRDFTPQLPEIILADGSHMALDPGALSAQGNTSVRITRTAENEIIYTLQVPQNDAIATDSPVEYNTLVMPARSSYRLQLADGTIIRLNGSSQLRYPETFGAGERRVFLQGEAFFEVAHAADRPFVVCAGDAEIRVHGTRFNVDWQGGNVVKTVLEEGSVEIGRSAEGGVVLTPGQSAEFDTQTGTCLITEANLEEAVSWCADEFYFSNRPLGDIMAHMAQWYGIRVKFDDASLATNRFTLMTPRYDDPEKIIELLEASSSNVAFRFSGDVVHIKSR